MLADAILRIARPTDNLAVIAKMYATGLDFVVLAQFHDHDGFDGVILGHPHRSEAVVPQGGFPFPVRLPC